MGPPSDALRLAFCVCGVMGSLLVYGVLQERIMTLPFGTGDRAQVFKHSLFLVSCNRLVAACIAAATLLSQGNTAELRPVAPLRNYAAVSLSNVLATTCQYEALKHVTFAVQTLGKCAKMLPVMAWGALILRKRYAARDVLLALAVTGGCFAFFMSGPTASRVAKAAAKAAAAGSSNSSSSSGGGGAGARSGVYGVALMALYLMADGYTSTTQQAMFRGYSMTTYNQVLFTALCSIALSSFGLLSSGQVPATFRFLAAHPEAAGSILALSAAASCGSLFISYTIKSFGALTFATIMTTRQLLSIVLSAALFGAPLTKGQWAATAVVGAALYYQGLTKEAKGGGKGGEGGGGSGSGKGRGGLRSGGSGSPAVMAIAGGGGGGGSGSSASSGGGRRTRSGAGSSMA